MQMDIKRSREIRTRFLTHPATISIFVVLILLYGWLDVGQTVPTATDTERMVATLGGAVLYYGGFYLFLPHILSSKLTSPLPFFWKIALLMTVVLCIEAVLNFYTIMRGAGFGWLANYFLSSIFTGLIGILAFCAIFRAQLKSVFEEDPLITILRPRKISAPDPLQALLPEDIRGEVLQLEAQTPYLLVTTTKGSALVRMSIKQAMEHVDENSGWLVHRSRWVHKSRIAGLRRQGKNRFFVDPDGNEFPISRGMEATLQAYLDLPV